MNYDATLLSEIGPNCYLSDQSCFQAVTGGTKNQTGISNQLCELTVYLAWEGTDANGINFNSAAYRFSRWSTAQISNFTSSLEEKTFFV